MIKKIMVFAAFLSISLYAGERLPVSVELRAAAFIPSSSRFREIYGNVNPSYQLEVKYPWGATRAIWGNFDWFNEKGSSTCSDTRTRVQIASLSVGMKYYYDMGQKLRAYLGLRAVVSGIKVKNRSYGSSSTVSPGLVFKSGIDFRMTQSFFLSLIHI